MYTKQQQDAINICGSNVLVSAGAGSGKTAVLTERIITKLKSGIDICDIVVITFTKFAAKEMKERIIEKLEKEIENGFDKLKEQLDKIDEAIISTFDSFCFNIVKEYSYLLDINAQIEMVDQSYIEYKKNKILKEIIVNNIDKIEVQKLLDIYSTTSEKDMIKNILRMYNTYQSSISNEQLKIEILFEEVYLNYISLLNEELNVLRQLPICTDGNLQVEKVEEIYVKVANATNYAELTRAINSVESFTMSSKKYENKEKIKVIITKVRDIESKIKELCIYEDLNVALNEYEKTNEHIDTILFIFKKLKQNLDQIKNEKNIYEYNDIALMAIDILKNNEDVLYTYQEEINEIMIDEYQDTNDIQEEIVNLISNNNVYMVGDIKQSIYRFRNAKPKYFSDKYESYQNKNGGELIDLNNNFRSREEVLTGINDIFINVMNKKYGGIDYVDSQILKSGNKDYIDTNEQYGLQILNYEKEDVVNMNKSEYEAHLIAQDIIKKVNSKFQVTENKTLKPCNFNDIVILVRSKSKFDLYKRIFESYKIPASIQKEFELLERQEIKVIKNLLCLLTASKKEDIKFLVTSTLRSYLYQLDDGLIEQYIKDEYEHLDFTNKFNKIKEDYSYKSFEQLVLEIIEEFEIIKKAHILNDAIGIEQNIEAFLILIKNLDKYEMTISELSDYLYHAEHEDSINLLAEINIELSNSVKIMTVHKSKGLEFPIVYALNFDSRFNIQELKENILFDRDLGFILDHQTKEGLKPTLAKKVLENNIKLEGISEEMRLLYVLLTRAKEQINIITSVDMENDNALEVTEYEQHKYNNFNKILRSNAKNLVKYVKKIEFEKIEFKEKEVKNQEDIITKEYKQIEIDVKEIQKIRASMNDSDELTDQERENMKFGDKLHRIIELVGLDNFDLAYDYLEEDKHFIIDQIKKIAIFEEYKNYYLEYQYVYEKDQVEVNGIIDLLIEKDDEYIIVDFKLNDISKIEYVNQLGIYKEYINSISDKEVSTYLYSFIQGELKKINCEE